MVVDGEETEDFRHGAEGKFLVAPLHEGKEIRDCAVAVVEGGLGGGVWGAEEREGWC